MSETGKNRPGRQACVRGRTVIILIGLLSLMGCAVVGPEYTRPTVPVPEQWNSASVTAQQQDAQQLAQRRPVNVHDGDKKVSHHIYL